MTKGKPEKRSYSSPLRNRQRELTRNIIMEVVAAFVEEGRIHTFSVQDVADRAGISYASVYRHFPTREALLEGMYNWASEIAKSQMPPAPRNIDEIPLWIEKSVQVFEQHASASKAVVAVLFALNINPQSRLQRDELIERLIDEGAPHLPRNVARQATAVIRFFASSQGWAALRQRFGLDAADTAAALTWALKALIREIRQFEAGAGQDRN